MANNKVPSVELTAIETADAPSAPALAAADETDGPRNEATMPPFDSTTTSGDSDVHVAICASLHEAPAVPSNADAAPTTTAMPDSSLRHVRRILSSSPSRLFRYSSSRELSSSLPQPVPPLKQRRDKLTRLLERRASSRRPSKQATAVRDILRRRCGGVLRYGALRYPGTTGAPCLWTCLRHGAPLPAIAAVAWELWRLPRPTLLISIAGFEQGTCELGLRMERTLLSGLSAAVAMTRSWVLSSGLRSSSGALVDRLIDSWEDERNPPLTIGIANWEDVDPRSTRGARLADQPDGTCLKVDDGFVPEGAAEPLSRRHAFQLLFQGPRMSQEELGRATSGLEFSSSASCLPSTTSTSSPSMAAHERSIAPSTLEDSFGDLYQESKGNVAVEQSAARWAGQMALEAALCTSSAHGEAATGSVLLCVGGGVGLLEQVLANLRSPVLCASRTGGSMRTILIICDSGGASTDLYQYLAHGQMPHVETHTPAPPLAAATLPQSPATSIVGSARCGPPMDNGVRGRVCSANATDRRAPRGRSGVSCRRPTAPLVRTRQRSGEGAVRCDRWLCSRLVCGTI